jgi:hypothetical protein
VITSSEISQIIAQQNATFAQNAGLPQAPTGFIDPRNPMNAIMGGPPPSGFVYGGNQVSLPAQHAALSNMGLSVMQGGYGAAAAVGGAVSFLGGWSTGPARFLNPFMTSFTHAGNVMTDAFRASNMGVAADAGFFQGIKSIAGFQGATVGARAGAIGSGIASGLVGGALVMGAYATLGMAAQFATNNIMQGASDVAQTGGMLDQLGTRQNLPNMGVHRWNFPEKLAMERAISGIALQSTFTSRSDIGGVLAGGLQSGMFRGVQDSGQLATALQELTNTLKDTARVYNTTIGGALPIINQFRQMGFTNIGAASQASIAARGYGVTGGYSPETINSFGTMGMQSMLGAGGSAEQIRQSAMASMRNAAAIGNMGLTGALSADQIFELTGQTGEAGSASLAQMMTGMSRHMMRGRFGRWATMALMDPNTGEFDPSAGSDLASFGGILGGARGHMGSRQSRIKWMLNRGRIAEEASGEMGAVAGGNLLHAIENRIGGNRSTDEIALIEERLTGIPQRQQNMLKQLAIMLPQMEGKLRETARADLEGQMGEAYIRENATIQAMMTRLERATIGKLTEPLKDIGRRMHTHISNAISGAMDDIAGVRRYESMPAFAQAYEKAQMGDDRLLNAMKSFSSGMGVPSQYSGMAGVAAVMQGGNGLPDGMYIPGMNDDSLGYNPLALAGIAGLGMGGTALLMGTSGLAGKGIAKGALSLGNKVASWGKYGMWPGVGIEAAGRGIGKVAGAAMKIGGPLFTLGAIGVDALLNYRDLSRIPDSSVTALAQEFSPGNVVGARGASADEAGLVAMWPGDTRVGQALATAGAMGLNNVFGSQGDRAFIREPALSAIAENMEEAATSVKGSGIGMSYLNRMGTRLQWEHQRWSNKGAKGDFSDTARSAIRASNLPSDVRDKALQAIDQMGGAKFMLGTVGATGGSMKSFTGQGRRAMTPQDAIDEITAMDYPGEYVRTKQQIIPGARGGLPATVVEGNLIPKDTFAAEAFNLRKATLKKELETSGFKGGYANLLGEIALGYKSGTMTPDQASSRIERFIGKSNLTNDQTLALRSYGGMSQEDFLREANPFVSRAAFNQENIADERDEQRSKYYTQQWGAFKEKRGDAMPGGLSAVDALMTDLTDGKSFNDGAARSIFANRVIGMKSEERAKLQRQIRKYLPVEATQLSIANQVERQFNRGGKLRKGRSAFREGFDWLMDQEGVSWGQLQKDLEQDADYQERRKLRRNDQSLENSAMLQKALEHLEDNPEAQALAKRYFEGGKLTPEMYDQIMSRSVKRGAAPGMKNSGVSYPGMDALTRSAADAAAAIDSMRGAFVKLAGEAGFPGVSIPPDGKGVSTTTPGG